jgi:hypothetical protein
MNIVKMLALGILCTLANSPAWAERGNELLDSYSVAPASTAQLRIKPQREYRSVVHEWVGDMERAGVYNRSLPTPYRVALPLVTLGEGGPTIKLTYARTLPGSAGSSGPLLFVMIPLH